MKQPIFYPGKQLNAEDLINLEEYAFSRTNIVIPDHGVVSLYNNSLPKIHKEGKETFFVITEITGITPSGRPISFKAAGSRMILKLPYDASGESLVWDIYIDDKHPANAEEINEGDEKYRLSYKPIDKDDFDKVPPVILHDKLYIGRYLLSRDENPKILSYPLIYSLASFNFPSTRWQEWTMPIRMALRELVKNDLNENIVFFIKHIIYNYPFWPLSQLFRACNQLQWLLGNDQELSSLLDEGKMQELQENLRINPLPDSLAKIPPADIPITIADLLVKGGRVPDEKLISMNELEINEEGLIIKRTFSGMTEIKFKFKNVMQETESLYVNNFYNYNIRPVEEIERNNNKCFSYAFIFDGSQPGDTVTSIFIPASWEPKSYRIYYRTIQN